MGSHHEIRFVVRAVDAQQRANRTLLARLLDPGADLGQPNVTPGGIRYRDALNEIKIATDKDGYFNVTLPSPGYYYLAASVQDDKASVKNAKRRASYAATLEAAAP